MQRRRSIPSAERWCNKACPVDPDNEQNHDVHRPILDAKSIGSGLDGVGVWISPR